MAENHFSVPPQYREEDDKTPICPAAGYTALAGSMEQTAVLRPKNYCDLATAAVVVIDADWRNRGQL